MSSSSTNVYSRNRNKLVDMIETHVTNNVEDDIKKMTISEGKDESDDNDDNDDDDDDDDVNNIMIEKTLLRKETSNEKRERKAKVKAERRDKRIAKKEMKKAYTEESNEQVRLANKQSHSSAPKGLSVFKYTL